MPVDHRQPQPSGEIVSIAHWEPDEDFPIGPQGAKPKRIVICPSPPPHPYLIGGHRYLFKEPSGSKSQQIWSEAIAYEVARDLGVKVPAAFLAYDPIGDRPGILVEFFYGYIWEPSTRFVHAIERFQGLSISVNEHRGSLRDNLKLSRLHQVVDCQEWWASTIAFDAIIGNTDRHSENWGFLITQSTPEEVTYSMAPAFDNGTSLGFLVQDVDLRKFLKPTRLEAFVSRGKHHFGWLGGSEQEANHVDLCEKFLEITGRAGPAMRQIASLGDSRIDDVMQWSSKFDFPVRFTSERAEFVSAQIRMRRDMIVAVIGAQRGTMD